MAEKTYANFRSPEFRLYYRNGTQFIQFSKGVYTTSDRIEQAAIEDHPTFGQTMIDTAAYDSSVSSAIEESEDDEEKDQEVEDFLEED